MTVMSDKAAPAIADELGAPKIEPALLDKAHFVILVHRLLRPLLRLIDRQPIAQTERDFHYRARVVCRCPKEAHVRALLLQGTNNGQLSLRRLERTDIEGNGPVEVDAHLTAHSKSDAVLEQVVRRLSLEPTVTVAGWRVEPRIG